MEMCTRVLFRDVSFFQGFVLFPNFVVRVFLFLCGPSLFCILLLVSHKYTYRANLVRFFVSFFFLLPTFIIGGEHSFRHYPELNNLPTAHSTTTIITTITTTFQFPFLTDLPKKKYPTNLVQILHLIILSKLNREEDIFHYNSVTFFSYHHQSCMTIIFRESGMNEY